MANQNKPTDINNILCANRSKLVRFFNGLNTDKGSNMEQSGMDCGTTLSMGWFCCAEDEMFDADKSQVVKEIMELVPTSPVGCSGELFKTVAV